MLPLSRLDCPLSLKTPNMGNPGELHAAFGSLCGEIRKTLLEYPKSVVLS